MKKLSAAIDPALSCAAFAVLDGERVLLRTSVPMKGRDGARLPVFVMDELEKLGLSLDDIAFWSVGAGPGSFTGLRLAAALVGGWCFDRPGVKSRSIPSAYALAAAVPGVSAGETVGCLYDGRNREILYYQTRLTESGWESTGEVAVLNREQALEFFASRPAETVVCSALEAAAVKNILPETVQLVQADELCTEVLALNPGEFDNDLTRLVYIRHAVYTV